MDAEAPAPAPSRGRQRPTQAEIQRMDIGQLLDTVRGLVQLQFADPPASASSTESGSSGADSLKLMLPAPAEWRGQTVREFDFDMLDSGEAESSADHLF